MPSDPVARMERGLKASAGIWLLGAIVTAAIAALLFMGRISGQDRIRVEQLLFTAWTLGPPCWFILQYRFWPPSPGGYERFRLHQALLKAAWAGILAFLAAITFGRWG